ncbi:chitin disaccharide deacetylase [Amphibacillus cookii]|uniref:chitin disaccharide deacetylase n=1 Tax=Amphibacillus cookii TaxID=767787 RepID=UPI00195C16E4|nr:chitin disaccharide deacetylase [Amphibacillus cookii]MBM7540884.1 putative glycoside hydrolase/deacetylase ChbG (UPF0249 family) [Amphibacillus cookii]
MKVIFNADDFGLTKGVTEGIIKAHLNGVINSTTLMMNGKAADYAIAMAKQTPSLPIGIHLVLTYGKPLCNDVPELVNANGDFKFTKDIEQLSPCEIVQIEQEWRTQIEAFLSAGLTLNHIDSHHHVHGWTALKGLIITLAKEYHVPLRYTHTLKDEKDLLYTDKLWARFNNNNHDLDVFQQLKKVKADSIEVITHPGIVDQDLRQVSSYVDQREQELEILCQLNVPNWVN